MRYHPDRNPDDPESEEKFKAVNEAYAILRDHKKRQTHDRFGRGYHQPYWGEDIFRDFDVSALFREFGLRFDEEIRARFFCRGRGGGCGRRKARFFRGGFAETPSGLHRNAVYDLHLTEMEALKGTEKEILLQKGREGKRYLIRIPAGVTMGTLIRLPMENPVGLQELYLRVKIVDSG